MISTDPCGVSCTPLAVINLNTQIFRGVHALTCDRYIDFTCPLVEWTALLLATMVRRAIR